jgi:prophage maintenance system killer protein
MLDIQIKYQATAFVKSPDIVPSPEIISTLLDMFRDKQMLPSIFQEISVGIQPQPRVRLSSPNNEWAINIASARIDIEKIAVSPKGGNLGPIDSFSQEATEMFSRLLGRFNKRAHRLAISTTDMLREMNEEQLSDVYEKLAKPIAYYAHHHPFEWNIRTAGKHEPVTIGQLNEGINSITAINRVSGHLIEPTGATRFDRIEVSFDINTEAENEDNRFAVENLGDFFNMALQIRARILNQVVELIRG